ncbi:hypothetical protein BROUX41_003389 [Berkeleyomyces rouxiae]
MNEWQVGIVPDLTFFNNAGSQEGVQRYGTGHPQYQNPADVNRRNDRMEYPFSQPGSHPHPGPGRPPMPVPQQPNQSQGPPQQPPQQQAPGAVPVPTSQLSPGQKQSQQPGPQHQPQAQDVKPVPNAPAPSRNRKRNAPGGAPKTPTGAATIPASPITGTLATGEQVVRSAARAGVPIGTDGVDGMPPGPPAPPAKKSRTNTPWTPAEEHRLKQMRDAGNSWAEIAKTFPARTEGSVKKHWYKDMHYAEFAEDESQALLNAMKEYENNRWKYIGQKVGKPAKACEQYAKEHFPEQIINITKPR